MIFKKVNKVFLKSREYKAAKKYIPVPSWRTLADLLVKMTGDLKAFVSQMPKDSGAE